MKYWEQIRAFLQGGIDWLMGIGDWIGANLNANLGNMFKRIVHVLQDILDWFNNIFTDIRKIFDGLINFVQGIFTGNWQQAWEGIKQIFMGVFDAMASTGDLVINIIIDLVMALGNFIAGVVDGIKLEFQEAWQAVVNGASSAWNGIKNIFGNVANFFGTIFSNAWNKVKAVFSTGGAIFTGIKDGIVNAFKRIVNAIIAGINRVITVPFNAINGVLRSIKNVEVARNKTI